MTSATDPAALPAGTVVPADIRAAGPAAERDYRTALGFERVLLGQLTQAMQATVATADAGAGAGDDDGGASADGAAADAATSSYRDMLPGTMADALVAGGGIGLAADLARSLKTGGS